MVHIELPKQQRDLIVERYQSGERYKRISKALDIPWSTVKAVVIKWRKHNTTETLPKAEPPSKHPKAEAVVRRELPKDQRDLIVERYKAGEGYKRISKSLDIPWNTVKAVVIKWRKHGTTQTLPRTGRPSKIDEKTRRKLVKEVSKRPTATLKELQEFLASTGCGLHVATISRILHMNGLWVREERRKALLTKKNIQTALKSAKTNIELPISTLPTPKSGDSAPEQADLEIDITKE